MRLILEDLLHDDESRYKVTVGGLSKHRTTGGFVSGILNGAVPLAGSNEFSSLKHELEDVPLIGGAVRFGNKAAKAAKLFSGKTFSLELEQTRKVWQESKMPQFNLEMTFFSLKSGDVGNRAVDKIKALYGAVYPSASANSFLVTAPLGYKWNSGKTLTASGTLNITIGSWLAINGLVVTDMNFTPSIELMRDGTPLYFTGSITLEPYRMITYEEFLLWFQRERPDTSRVIDGSAGTTSAGSNTIDLGTIA